MTEPKTADPPGRCPGAYQPQNIRKDRGNSLVDRGRGRQVKGIETKAICDGAGGRGNERNDDDRREACDTDDKETKKDVGRSDGAEDRPAQLEENGRRRHDGWLVDLYRRLGTGPRKRRDLLVHKNGGGSKGQANGRGLVANSQSVEKLEIARALLYVVRRK